MQTKVLFIALFLSLILASPAYGLLTDGAVVGIGQETTWRATVELPDDFGVVGGVTEFVVTTDCEDWCDLHYAKVITDPQNPIRLPLYISSKGKPLGAEKSFKISISALGLTNSFNYGVCVTQSANVNNGKGSPCKAVNSNNDVLSLSISPDTVYALPNRQFQYNITLYSQAVLDVEVKSSTGATWTVTTDPDKRTVLTDKYTAGQDSEQITVEATIKNCKNSAFCKKTASAIIIPSAPPANRASGDFAIKIDPQKISAKKGFPVSYSLDITNYRKEKSYDIDIILPTEGLESDFSPAKSKPIAGTETINFKVTPTGDQSSYTFQIKASSSENVTKLTDATINMDEVVNDAGNAAATAGTDDDTIRKLNEFKARYSNSDLCTQLTGADSTLSNSSKPTTRPSPRSTLPSQPAQQPINIVDLLMIIIPAVIVVAVLMVLLVRKRKPVRQEGEEEYEGDYSWK